MFAFFPANSQTWLSSSFISILIAHPCEEFRKAHFWKSHFWFKIFQCGNEKRHEGVKCLPPEEAQSKCGSFSSSFQDPQLSQETLPPSPTPIVSFFLNWYIIIAHIYGVQCKVSIYWVMVKSGWFACPSFQVVRVALKWKHSKSSLRETFVANFTLCATQC